MDIKKLEEKIYSMSNSFLPLDMFFNDIRDNKAENYDKERAYKDLEIIADFIIDQQEQIKKLTDRWNILREYIENEMEHDKKQPGYDSEYYVVEEEDILSQTQILEVII